MRCAGLLRCLCACTRAQQQEQVMRGQAGRTGGGWSAGDTINPVGIDMEDKAVGGREMRTQTQRFAHDNDSRIYDKE